MITKFIEVLEASSSCFLEIKLPSGEFIPQHFHITEVGRVQKTFIDCGGTLRESVSCVLQVWTAHDLEHRLLAGKLAGVLKLAEKVLQSDSLPIEFELGICNGKYGNDIISHYSLDRVDHESNKLIFTLSGKKTGCLAPDKCGVNKCCSGGC